MKITKILLLILASSISLHSQEKQERLDEIIITSTRIDLPFSENSRTIEIITSEEIKNSAATNVADLLQQFAGVDIRRRGTAGMQADLYIRGGGFDQTLLLIDGIKVEDAQTGHHTMNLALPIEVIERIEIIKGPAARVFGQNAFTGAVNIITKKKTENLVSVNGQLGSYNQLNGAVTIGKTFDNSSYIFQALKNTSDGYRYNTDYDNENYFFKGRFNTKKNPIELLATFSERKFGANGFYATPSATDQYEETQASLIGLSTQFKKGNFNFKPRVYWRRNQDEYIYIRHNPSVYRNLHKTNKLGVAIDVSYTSKLGITGFGVDVASINLSSNNLGDRDRIMATLFIEQQFKLLDYKLDITPGLAVNYFSDFKFHAFPGIDIGYKINENTKLYTNVGYTYRIPTYTDLYYSDRTTLGNENLEPEEAISEELGVKYTKNNFNFSLAIFNRDSKKLIDYIKQNQTDLWQATNIRNLNTKGFEVNTHYVFKLGSFNQNINASYNYLKDYLESINLPFSRYSINSLQHQAIGKLSTQFLENLFQNIIYKYAKRTDNNSYNVLDASVLFNVENLELSFLFNNILDEEYSETNLVPMPGRNFLFGMKYNFK